MRIAALLLSASVACGGGLDAQAQTRDETLADIRQELSVLYVEVQRLKRELSTTTGAQAPVAGGSALQRIDAIEQELQRLTSRTEEMGHRIERVVSDGTRVVGDLEFRLCELEPGCDVGNLKDTPSLGGEPPAGTTPPAPLITPETAPGEGAELAIGEKADFDAARAALEAGETADAVRRFAAFTDTYPGSPLSGEAHFLRGQALAAEGDTAAAARAYLESFSGSPGGTHAAEALFRLGLSLDELGQSREACVTLSEVGARFPGSAEAQDASAAMDAIGCN